MVEQSKKILSQPDERVGPQGSRHHYNRGLLRRLEMPDYTDIILQVFRVGDTAIATVPFETFAETGLEIKDRSPFSPTFTISFANGSHGYLPTP